MKIKKYAYIIICLFVLMVCVCDNNHQKRDDNTIFSSVSKDTESRTDIREALYNDIISQYVDVINQNFYKLINKSDKWDLIGKDVNRELISNSFNYNQYYVYYALEDLDENGIPELLICGSGKNGMLIYYDLFTFDGISAVNSFTKLGYEFGYRNNFTVYSNGIIEVGWSNSGTCNGTEFYRISSDGYSMVLIDSVSLKVNAYGLTQYYHDKEGNIKISEEEFYSILDSYRGEGPETLSWIEIKP